MNTLETLFRPLTALVNRQIKATTPARELCAELDGKVMAVRVKDTGLAMYICICANEIELLGDIDGDPDIAITGSLLSLARLATSSGEDAIRDGSLAGADKGDHTRAGTLCRARRQGDGGACQRYRPGDVYLHLCK